MENERNTTGSVMLLRAVAPLFSSLPCCSRCCAALKRESVRQSAQTLRRGSRAENSARIDFGSRIYGKEIAWGKRSSEPEASIMCARNKSAFLIGSTKRRAIPPIPVFDDKIREQRVRTARKVQNRIVSDDQIVRIVRNVARRDYLLRVLPHNVRIAAAALAPNHRYSPC